MKFKNLKIGDTFDFVDPDKIGFNSFFDTCQKISTRKYKSLTTDIEHRVGSINAIVYHFPRERQKEEYQEIFFKDLELSKFLQNIDENWTYQSYTKTEEPMTFWKTSKNKVIGYTKYNNSTCEKRTFIHEDYINIAKRRTK